MLSFACPGLALWDGCEKNKKLKLKNKKLFDLRQSVDCQIFREYPRKELYSALAFHHSSSMISNSPFR